MYIAFENLPDHARVWIYQADRKIKSSETAIISEALRAFTESWTVHGQPMEASFTIRFDQFIILAAHDQASGCSIDSSVRAMKEIGTATGIDFFNRTQVAFLRGEEAVLIPLADLKSEYAGKKWNEDVLTFNNLVDTKSALEKTWLIPAGSTWLKRYASPQSVAS